MTYDLNTPSIARLWPYLPDWRSAYELRRSFLTDIITSRSNREQRRALRDVPRLSARHTSYIGGTELQAAKLYLRAWQNKPAAVPDFARWVATTGDSGLGTDTLTIATPPAWIAVDRLIVLCGSGGTIELHTVESVVGSTVTIVGALAQAWPSGTIVRPALFGLLDGQMRGSRITRGDQRLETNIAVYPGGEPPEDEGVAGTLFNSREIFEHEPNFSSQPSIDYIWPVEQVDYDIGRTAQFRPVDRAEHLIEAEFAGLSADNAQAIEQFFLRMKGRRGSFYRSSCEKDMTLAANVSASTQMNVVGTALATLFGSIDYAANYVAIEIVQTDGTRLRRRVTAIAINGSNSRVTLSSAITTTLATTARISWMPLVRFANDDLITRWITPSKATIRASFQTVKQ